MLYYKIEFVMQRSSTRPNNMNTVRNSHQPNETRGSSIGRQILRTHRNLCTSYLHRPQVICFVMRAQCLLAVTTSCARDQVAKNPPNPNTPPSGGPPSPAHSPYRLLEGWTNPNPNPCERRTCESSFSCFRFVLPPIVLIVS